MNSILSKTITYARHDPEALMNANTKYLRLYRIGEYLLTLEKIEAEYQT